MLPVQLLSVGRSDSTSTTTTAPPTQTSPLDRSTWHTGRRQPVCFYCLQFPSSSSFADATPPTLLLLRWHCRDDHIHRRRQRRARHGLDRRPSVRGRMPRTVRVRVDGRRARGVSKRVSHVVPRHVSRGGENLVRAAALLGTVPIRVHATGGASVRHASCGRLTKYVTYT